MSALMVALEFVRACLDDFLCITNANLEDHLDKLNMVLTRLCEAGLQINARKSSFCASKTEYLGYTLTRTGIKPQQKKGNRPLVCFSRKLLTAQQKYSVTKLELLAIVETLKELKCMLWGQRSKVYTDNKNLIQDACGLTSDRVC
eukprot:CCRYP_013508-RA/>CCRYP_013508-RA protein AED:0.45 eAED:0.45 QI:0/0/0/1/0/0/2/0/144